MAEIRSAYKGSVIDLELKEGEFPSGVSVSRILILQEKEVCCATILQAVKTATGWKTTLDTSTVLYTGTYIDRWYLSNGAIVEKTFKLTNALTPEITRTDSGSPFYYSKDIAYSKRNNGDLYKIYDEESIMSKIKSVIMTIKGSLYYEPSHGTDLYRFLFSMSPTVALDMQNEVREQLDKQVPQIQVHEVRVEETTKGYYTILILFYNLASAAPQELLSTENMKLEVSIEGVIS